MGLVSVEVCQKKGEISEAAFLVLRETLHEYVHPKVVWGETEIGGGKREFGFDPKAKILNLTHKRMTDGIIFRLMRLIQIIFRENVPIAELSTQFLFCENQIYLHPGRLTIGEELNHEVISNIFDMIEFVDFAYHRTLSRLCRAAEGDSWDVVKLVVDALVKAERDGFMTFNVKEKTYRIMPKRIPVEGTIIDLAEKANPREERSRLILLHRGGYINRDGTIDKEKMRIGYQNIHSTLGEWVEVYRDELQGMAGRVNLKNHGENADWRKFSLDPAVILQEAGLADSSDPSSDTVSSEEDEPRMQLLKKRLQLFKSGELMVEEDMSPDMQEFVKRYRPDDGDAEEGAYYMRRAREDRVFWEFVTRHTRAAKYENWTIFQFSVTKASGGAQQLEDFRKRVYQLEREEDNWWATQPDRPRSPSEFQKRLAARRKRLTLAK